MGGSWESTLWLKCLLLVRRLTGRSVAVTAVQWIQCEVFLARHLTLRAAGIKL